MSARRARPRRTWVQRGFLLLNVVIVAAGLTAAVALAVAKDTVSSIPRTGYGNTLAADVEEGEPLNFLLIGADSITTLPPDHPLRQSRDAGLRTDTLMVLRMNPATGEASVLSIPRDLWVPVPGHSYHLKITEVLAYTDRPTLVQTIQDFLHIPIHHAVQVDFNGFLEMVKVLDGIKMYVDYPLRDRKAALSIPDTGCLTLTPEQALGFVRSRTMQALVDGQWRLVDGRGDLARIERQQDFLTLAIDRAINKGVRNPATLKSLVDDVAAGGFVNLDERLTFKQIIDLGERFRDFAAEGLEKYTLPVVLGSEGTEEKPISVVYLVEDDAQRVLDVFRGSTDAQAFRVAVRNGTGESGIAGAVATELENRGFRVVDASDAESYDFDRTVIRAGESQVDSAMLLSRWLVNGAQLETRDTAGDEPVELIIGRDFAGILDEPSEAPVATPTPTGAVGETTPLPVPTAAPTPVPTPTPQPLVRVRAC